MTKTPLVLIIEDDDWFAEQETRTLEAAGYRVMRAANGLAAIEALDARMPDILVLDIFLPGPNAITLLHEIQSYVDLARLPIIICSNSAADVPSSSLEKYGVRQVIDKALMHPGDLVSAVRGGLA